MMNSFSIIIGKLPLYFLITFLAYLGVFLVFFTVSLFTGGGPQAVVSAYDDTDSSNYTSLSDDPNVVSVGLSNAIHQLGKNIESAGAHISAMGTYVAETATFVATTIARQTAHVTVTVVKNTASFTVYAVKQTANAAFFVIKTVASTVKTVATFSFTVLGNITGPPARSVSSIFREPVLARAVTPSAYITDIPIIEADSPEIQKAITALAEDDTNPTDVKAANTEEEAAEVRWPTTGRITAPFGVPHWPFQPVHTGLDISSQSASGVNPIYPFRAGTVVATVESNVGLGNYVEVDHGNDISSVYAHLASIAVIEGQPVTTDTELGREGTTGLSTGVHLHFEIRINGQTTDPLPFLNN